MDRYSYNMYSTWFPGGLQRRKKFLYGSGEKMTDTDVRAQAALLREGVPMATPTFDGATPEEIKAKEEAGLPYTIRVKVPANETYEFDDMIRGHVSFESEDIGDWVLIKANGIPTYNFAVVIDDHTMEISHVFRGEEHLSNTPKQLMIYEMLGWEAPTYGHMTLIVNENRKKLSKRDETIMQFVSQYKEEGYLPDAMFNFMALLGWSPEGEQEIFDHQGLIEAFSETRLHQ